jgi:hypothetical protein
MTFLKWLSPRLMVLLLVISPIPLLWGALMFCDWIDGPQYAHETCVETSRGATVCGELVSN